MLEKLRKATDSWFIKGFLGLIILSFAVWGVGNNFTRSLTASPLLAVGSVDIPPSAIAREIQNQLNRLRQMLRTNITPEQARGMGVTDLAIRQLIQMSMLDQETQRMGLGIDRQNIISTITGLRAFQGPEGTFDERVYEETLRHNGFTEATFVAQMRQELIRKQLIDAVQRPVRVPDPLVQTLFRQRFQKRTVTMVRLAAASMIDIPTADDAELQTFLEAEADSFTVPELRRASYLSVVPMDLTDRVMVDEKELLERYEERRDEYFVAEKRTLHQMVFADEAKARRAHDALQSGNQWDQVATDHGVVSIPMGAVTREALFGGLVEPVFAAAPESVVPPTKSDFGWHLIRVDAVEPEFVTPFETARPDLYREVALDLAVDALYDFVIEWEDELASGSTLEEAAKALDLPLRTIEGVASDGTNASGEEGTGLSANAAFLDTLFAMEPGRVSALVDAGKEQYFCLRVDEVIPPTLPPLTEIRGAVDQAWQKARRADKTAAEGTDLLGAVKDDGTPLAEAAAAINAKVQTIKNMGRTDRRLPSSVMADLFEMQTGEWRLAEDGDDRYLLRLDDVALPDPTQAPDKIKALRQQLRREMRQDLFAGLDAALHNVYPVTIDRSRIEQMF